MLKKKKTSSIMAVSTKKSQHFVKSAKNTHENNKDLKQHVETLKNDLAQELKISLEKPKQEKRIKALVGYQQKLLLSSDPLVRVYSQIIVLVKKLKELYAKQKEEIQKIISIDEPIEYRKTKISYVLNKNRVKVFELEEKIKDLKTLVHIYQQNKNIKDHKEDKKLTEILTIEQKIKLNEIFEMAQKSFEEYIVVNKELRNTIIGHENSNSIHKIKDLYIEYQLILRQEIKKFEEKFASSNDNILLEHLKLLSCLSLDFKRFTEFSIFLQRKIQSSFNSVKNLKSVFESHYHDDVKEIEEMVKQIQSQNTKDNTDLISIINSHKESILKHQLDSEHNVKSLVKFIDELYNNQVSYLEEKINTFYSIKNSKVDNVLAVNSEFLYKFAENDFKQNIKELKLKYSGIISPLMNDFNEYQKITEKDYCLDKFVSEKKINELKLLETKIVNKFVELFETEKANIIAEFSKKELLIKSHKAYTESEFLVLIETLNNDRKLTIKNLLKEFANYWDRVNIDFDFEARKYLIRLHYENSPWSNFWRKGEKSWMHDYLLINLNAQYLKIIGDSLKSISVESELLFSISKAMIQYNEKTRDIMKKRDSIEYEQLIKAHTLPEASIVEIKKDFNKQIQLLKIEFQQMTDVIKSIN